MTTTDDCDCPGCRADDGCYWPRGVTGQAPWTASTLDPAELSPRVVELIQRIAPDRVKSEPES